VSVEVAAEVVRHEVVMNPPCDILFATDFAERDDQAFAVARALARDRGGRLVVLHVLRRDGPRVGIGRSLVQLGTGAEAERAWRQLQRFDAGAEVLLERRLAEGTAAEEILRIAEETRCELIVLGSEGRRPGRVAEYLLDRAPCDVVLVSTREPHLV
jgi:nucleotide-binding universal stress UspA family protein